MWSSSYISFGSSSAATCTSSATAMTSRCTMHMASASKDPKMAQHYKTVSAVLFSLDIGALQMCHCYRACGPDVNACHGNM